MGEKSMLFQGQNFRVSRVSKNRYEFRSPYAITYGTAGEIEKIIADQTTYAQQSEAELAKARRAVLLSALADGVPIAKDPAPAPLPAPPAPPAPATASASSASTTPKPAASRPAAPVPKRRRHSVAIVENVAESVVSTSAPDAPAKRGKPRRYGVSYMALLRAKEAEEKCG